MRPSSLLTSDGWPYLLVPFIPLAVVLDLVGAGAVAIFTVSALGVIPTAAMMGRATEELAARSGPGIGGLLNVTFGNAPELIIALFALEAGLHEVVKASIVGSIIGNVLLVLGASMIAGGARRRGEIQQFNRSAASSQASMLLLATVAVIMPAVYVMVDANGLPSPTAELTNFTPEVEHLSLITAIVLIGAYLAGLLFSLRTHSNLFNLEEGEELAEDAWSVKRSVTMLAIAGALVAVMSEILVGSISETAEKAGISEFFIGAIVVAIVGNAAEHWVAVLVARKGKMNLAVNISIGSSAQVALFVAPVLVLASYLIGPGPMPLVFNGFELGALVLAALIANQITSDGESTWFKGVQMIAVYVIIAVAFYVA
ncbi:MAG: calcium/proton exchanger [Actinobacteria bacterium]|nr:calcium/proton exchanger [Actinomycetota bacterium]